MKNKQFLLAALTATVVLFILNAIIYVTYLGDFFKTHTPLPEDVYNKVTRAEADTDVISVILCSVAIGFFVATVMKWSGARSFTSGLRSGFIFAILFLISVDFGLYAVQNYYSLSGILLDICSSTVAVTLGFTSSAWVMGKGKPATA